MSIKRRVYTRHNISLRVYLRIHGDWLEGATVDVSRRGMFVAIEPVLAVGEDVHIRAEMLDGRMLNLGGTIRRVVPKGGGGDAGLAIELTRTSMAGQAIWDHFVLRVGGEAAAAEAGPALADDGVLDPGPAGVSAPTRPAAAGRRPHIITRPRDEAQLRAIARNLSRHKRLHLRSAVVCAHGAAVSVVIAHPESDAEFVLDGTASRAIVDETARQIGLVVTFGELGAVVMQSFGEFLTGGQTQGLEASPLDRQISALRQACVADPSSVEALSALGWALILERGDVPAAILAFERATMLAPAETEVRWGLALARALVGDGAGAVEMAKAARRQR